MDKDYIPVLKLVTVLLSVVVAVLIVLTVVTYYQKYKTLSKTPSISAQPTPTLVLKHLTAQESGFLLASTVTLDTPSGMKKLDCAKFWHFVPGDSTLTCQDNQDPTKIPMTVYADTPLTFKTTSQDKKSSNLRQNLSYGGKSAQDFTGSFTQKGVAHQYKMTAVENNQEAYLYIVLTDLNYDSQYSQLLSSLKFK
ncbi:MAG: hypothetical protein HYW33_01855 [Candidatus Blackburnbacteria bacterium]|nr:hypothetical protein [Candidatus Blackburnbacteria bacterium]